MSTVESHGWRHLAPFRWDGRILRRAEVLGGRVTELEISSDGNLLMVSGARDSDELRRKITRMFQLDVDTTGFIDLARASPDFEWVVRARFGRLLCGSTLWEDAVKIIATTNTTWAQTVRMAGLLVEKCGKNGAFPEPHEVARFTPDELQRDCRLGYRAKSIHALASIDLTQPLPEATADRYAFYLDLPGIGPYGAAHLLAMDGRHDFIAVDTEFRRFVREKYHGGRRVTDTAMLRRYAKWGRWKYLAYWSDLWKGVAEPLQPAAGEDK